MLYHLETIKVLCFWHHGFICFSVLGTHDEALALIFDILLMDTDFYLLLYFMLIGCLGRFPWKQTNIRGFTD